MELLDSNHRYPISLSDALQYRIRSPGHGHHLAGCSAPVKDSDNINLTVPIKFCPVLYYKLSWFPAKPGWFPSKPGMNHVTFLSFCWVYIVTFLLWLTNKLPPHLDKTVNFLILILLRDCLLMMKLDCGGCMNKKWKELWIPIHI